METITPAGKFWRFFVVLGLSGFWATAAAEPKDYTVLPPELATLETQFAQEIYPLLTRGGGSSCVSCHDEETDAGLVLVGDARDDFHILLAQGYLIPGRPDSMLDRLEATNPKRRMPKGKNAPVWSAEELAKLKNFASSVAGAEAGTTQDDVFPWELLAPYRGEIPEFEADTQFLTWTQLKGKVATLFEDNWVREGVDQFDANVALFGGADFRTRFSESSRATSGYLAALKILAKDLAERAYHLRRGPFAGFSSPPPAESDRDETIDRLYRHLLLRSPSPQERTEARLLLTGIEDRKTALANQDHELVFRLEVSDPVNERQAIRTVRLPIVATALPVSQQLLDQERTGESSGVGAGEPDGNSPKRLTLDSMFKLRAGVTGQRLILYASETHAPVSFAGLLLEHVEGQTVEWLEVRDRRIKLEGGWKLNDRHGYWSAEEESDNFDQALIEIPLTPEFDGDYRITLFWRPAKFSARNVLVEVHHQGTISTTANKTDGPEPRDGTVRFTFDGRVDTQPYVEFEPAFRFGETGHAEISNRGTHAKVAVGPLAFLEPSGGKTFEVDTKEAGGFEEWSPFKAISFGAYNQRGHRVEDQNRRKGELFLRYAPQIRTKDGWSQDRFYRLRLYYPGKRDHDPRIPLSIKAEASTPLIRLNRPLRAPAGSEVTLDASESFTVQAGPLNYLWTQLAGAPVKPQESEGKLTFQAPRRDAAYEGWLALVQALVRHPDFLFTRAPALDWVKDRTDRRRLLLSRLALDLTGRAPSVPELERFLGRWNWDEAVGYYLDSEDFRNFYFHRIRLYLESQGTPRQDEPVRLWCYVAFNDRPFQEILTADYTVGPDLKRRTRPGYHGRTGLLTTAGFIEGKPGLPHYNYAAQVSMLFLGYRYEVSSEIVEQREGATALGTTDPNSSCYSCHKILTPLAFQRNFWTDAGVFRIHDEYGLPIEASDHGLVREYPFAGEGMEAFALQAVKKERFVRTIIDTHFNFIFGRSLRYRTDERGLYRELWDRMQQNGFTIRDLFRALVTSPRYLETDDFARLSADNK